MPYHKVTADWPRLASVNWACGRVETSDLPRVVWEYYTDGAISVCVDGRLVPRVKGQPRPGCAICGETTHRAASPGYRQLSRWPWVAPCVCSMLDSGQSSRRYVSQYTVSRELRLWAAAAIIIGVAAVLSVSVLLRGAP